MNTQEKVPVKKAMITIAFITLAIAGTAWLSFFYIKFVKERHGQDPAYKIVALIQNCHSRESLKTAYLAELLNLSVDQPQNLYRFNAKEAKKLLLQCPLIKKADVKKVRPGIVEVDYELREPIAFLVDFANTLVDTEGVAFPYQPFFTPKKLPEVYLGLNDEKIIQPNEVWGRSFIDRRMDLAITLLNEVPKDFPALKLIDVSQAYAESFGRREIILGVEEQEKSEDGIKTHLYLFPKILRLETSTYKDGLKRYHLLKEKLKRDLPAFTDATVTQMQTITIDLRLPQLAYVLEEKKSI